MVDALFLALRRAARRHHEVADLGMQCRCARESLIEDAVRIQLTAIAARDAKRAFAKLAPSTQHYFAQPDQYLEAIASDLPPILATRHFAFLGAGRDKTGANQLVLITDGDGRDWLATFQVERQSAGDWRVKDCVVQAAVGQLA